MNINPGEFNKYIEFYSHATSKDADGYETGAEVLEYSCKAKFSRTSGTEIIKANADFTDVKVRFLIRHPKTEITRKMKIKYDGNYYEIVYLNDYNDEHKYIEIYCSMVTNNG